MDRLDLGWTAGVIDGEGCIRLRYHGKNSNPEVLVGQKDVRLLIRLQVIWGGSIRMNRQGYWLWCLSSRMAIAMLKEIEPFLVVKGEQARVLLEYRAWSGQNRADMARRLSALKVVGR